MSEENHVVIIQRQFGIAVKAMTRKLEELGYHTDVMEPDTNLIQARIPQTALFILFLPRERKDGGDLNRICETIRESGKKVMLVGERENRSGWLERCPDMDNCPWLDRPVDMGALGVAVEAAIKGGAAVETVTRSAPPDSKKKILIVDDDPAYAGMVRAWIKDVYKVDIVTAATRAMGFLTKNGADLILLDYAMPVVDGPQLLKMLRGEPKTKEIPVVFLTGVETADDMKHIIGLKPDGYILKSTTREVLLGYIADVFSDIEERQAFQNRILDHERQQRELGAMITAMAADYRSVYYIDLDKDTGVCYRANAELSNGMKEGDIFAFREKFALFADACVSEADRAGFLDFIRPEHIRARLAEETVISHRYLAIRDGKENYEMLRMADAQRTETGGDKAIHAVSAAFSDVDRETREAMEKSRALSDALAQAREANAAKTSFLNSMSHEIRTPMNAVMGLNSLALKEPGLPDRVRDYLEKMSESASRLFSMINSILDMSRMESGGVTLENGEFAFCDMLEQVNAEILAQCQQKKLQYDFQVNGDTDASYIGDETKLRQVLLNILENAVKFTPAPGTVTLLAERTARFEDKATLRFTVKDTGIGMDADFLPRMFDAFAQEDVDKANKYGSTGLGLAIVKNIVEAMNGKIEAESEKGVGSTFVFTVTLKVPEQSAGDAENVEARKADLTGKRVLLAEDTPINAEIMMELLEEMREMKVDHAENGQIAVEMFRDSPVNAYSAVLMDIRMPVLDGLGAAEAIRAMDRPDAKTVPIIAVTANAFEEDVQRSLQAGMNAHLNKPLDPDSLFETLETLIRNE